MANECMVCSEELACPQACISLHCRENGQKPRGQRGMNVRVCTMDQVRNLVATLGSTHIGANLHCGHTLCMECMAGIIKSGSNMCPYKCLPPIAPMSKQMDVPVDPEYYGDLYQNEITQREDLRRGIHDEDFTTVQERIDELAASSNPEDRALAAVRQEVLDKVVAARSEVALKEENSPAWSGSESDEEESEQTTHVRALWKALFEDEDVESMDESPRTLAAIHLAGMLTLCVNMVGYHNFYRTRSFINSIDACDNWTRLYRAHDSMDRLDTLPWAKARETLEENYGIIQDAKKLFEAARNFQVNGNKMPVKIFNIFIAWNHMSTMVVQHALGAQRGKCTPRQFAAAIKCIDAFYGPLGIEMRREFMVLELTEWKILRKYNWFPDWPEPDCQEDCQELPVSALSKFSSVSKPVPGQAGDFDRWMHDVMDQVRNSRDATGGSGGVHDSSAAWVAAGLVLTTLVMTTLK